ncbi:MAG: hypothetical protein HGA87_04095, partial [Desulfobulbaceae bacterium]|nr:hypothetical protein [Desulfobulbaceae bacterium]
VIEALYSFHTGVIYEDMLRSDLSLPIVSCRFELEKGNILDLLESNRIPSRLLKAIKDSKDFILTRSWKADRSSTLFISSDEILNFYEKQEIEAEKSAVK